MNEHTRESGDVRRPLLYAEGAEVVDADSIRESPGAVLIERGAGGDRVLAAGTPGEVKHHPGMEHSERLVLSDRVITPAFVNAHVHLDLTHLGPLPYASGGGFVGWADRVREGRAHDSETLAASVRDGIERSIRGGVACIGDIAGVGSLVPARTLAASGLCGVSFVEFFGVGLRQEAAINAMARTLAEGLGTIETEGVRLSVQPHAPYSAGVRLYRAARELVPANMPIATHLAETPEEAEFVRTGGGPSRAFLERMGVWDDSILDEVGRGLSPVAHLRDVLNAGRMLLAHVNIASDEDLERLSSSEASVVLCPRCHAYFWREREFGGHRYREMLERGITVALGTDSIINLPESESLRLSPLDEMRLLFTRDGVDARTLLAMATTYGCVAVGRSPDEGRLGPACRGVVALEGASLEDAVGRAGDVEWLTRPPACG